MEIVEDRYGRGSTLITSQLPVDKWHDVIDEPTFADAILDRLVHNAYRLALGGPSLRNPEAGNAEPASVDAEPAGSKTITHTKPTKGVKK
jgi:DNA replication protein DnaC